MREMKPYDLVIGGASASSADGATFTVDEPAQGEPMAEVARAGAEDAHRAVTAARLAFDDGDARHPALHRGEERLLLVDVAPYTR